MTNQTLWEDDQTYPLNKAMLSRTLSIPPDISLLAFDSVSSIKVVGGNGWPIAVGDEIFWIDTDTLLSWTDLDSGSEQNGKDYYIYICNDGTSTPLFKISANSTAPSGFDQSNSRKIGGFHNNPDGDILRYSIWDLNHRPACSPEGMVRSQYLPLWYDIYLPSDDGSGGVKSAYGATILDNLSWFDFIQRGLKVGKRLLTYQEFIDLANGTPEEANISGSTDPATTGGHQNTNNQRIISTIGAEDTVGVQWQFGLDLVLTIDGNKAGSWVFGWKDLPTGIGSAYILNATNNYGMGVPLFGGKWDSGLNAGSRAISLEHKPWDFGTDITARFCCPEK